MGVYVGPRGHFVHYGLRGGAMLNQVYVFESPKALAGEEDWGTPDELDAAFEHTVDFVRDEVAHMWRDKWWRMFDREPLDDWVHGRIALRPAPARRRRRRLGRRARRVQRGPSGALPPGTDHVPGLG
ncbi:hypothetical protein [Gordonia sihwensis]|uniref:hypothetical protein n=1 Tax=Gordonia sihwensis TaxID=173559 RepID=UPI0018CF2D58|nr:hypothetical protein [Gordonia sihwensis]